MTSGRPARRWTGKEAFWAPRVHALMRRVDLVMAALALVAALVAAVLVRSWLLAILFLVMAAIFAWQPRRSSR
jgi:hypothetical protein